MGNIAEKQLRAVSWGEAVKEILKGQSCRGLGQKGLMEQIRVDDTPDKQSQEKSNVCLEMTAESDYEFVVRAAKRYNYEFYTDLGTVYFRKSMQEEIPLMELGPGRGVLGYQMSYDIRGLAREFETRGMDDRKGELISCKKKSADKLSSGNRVNAVLSGTAKVCIDASVRSQPEVQARTEALAEKTAWSFGRLECECIGIPVLKPGYFVEMAGFGKGVDNQFYINKVRHELSGEKGYRTLLSGQAASVGES